MGYDWRCGIFYIIIRWRKKCLWDEGVAYYWDFWVSSRPALVTDITVRQRWLWHHQKFRYLCSPVIYQFTKNWLISSNMIQYHQEKRNVILFQGMMMTGMNPRVDFWIHWIPIQSKCHQRLFSKGSSLAHNSLTCQTIRYHDICDTKYFLISSAFVTRINFTHFSTVCKV